MVSIVRLNRGRGRAETEGEGEENSQSNRGAPLLVTMRTAGQKWAVVGRSNIGLVGLGKLKIDRVMIVPDLSVREREADMKLRGAEKKERAGKKGHLYK